MSEANEARMARLRIPALYSSSIHAASAASHVSSAALDLITRVVLEAPTLAMRDRIRSGLIAAGFGVEADQTPVPQHVIDAVDKAMGAPRYIAASAEEVARAVLHAAGVEGY